MTKPQMTEETLNAALDYINQSEDLDQESTALTNRFLKGLVGAARIAIVHANKNPQSDIAEKLRDLNAVI